MAAAAAPALAVGPVGDIEAQHQKIAREEYKYQSARVKGALHAQLMVAMMLYPTMLGFCLAVRLGRFNLMVPTPHLNTAPPPTAELGSDRDLWRTSGTGDIVLLIFTFLVASALHLFLASFLLMRGGVGSANMSRWFSWVAPIVFWATTSIYFWYFVKVARYGPAIGEWIVAGVFSGFILGGTLYMIIVPWQTERVVVGLHGAGVRARPPQLPN